MSEPSAVATGDPRAEQPAPVNRLLVMLCAVASLGGLLFGFDTAVISGAILMVSRQFALSPIQEGLFTSSALMGCIGGAAVCGWLADRFGRKPVLLASGLLFVGSAIGSAIPEAY